MRGRCKAVGAWRRTREEADACANPHHWDHHHRTEYMQYNTYTSQGCWLPQREWWCSNANYYHKKPAMEAQISEEGVTNSDPSRVEALTIAGACIEHPRLRFLRFYCKHAI